MSHDGGVQVQVGVGPQGKASEKQQPAQQVAAPTQAAAADPETAPEGRSSTCMWALFVLGWVFPPCWWAGTAAGLRTGGPHECLVKRSLMNKSALMAWAASIAMTFISVVVLILVLAIYFGRPAPRDGPYYITLAGPGDVFPSLSDTQQLSLMSQALYTGLALPGAYPPSGISLWVDSSTTLPTSSPEPARRKLLQDTLPANETTEIAVLAYTLKKTADLSDIATLATRIEDGSAADGVSEALLTTGLVAEEHVGKLSLGLVGSVSRDKLAAILERREGNRALNLVPVGKRCKGAWSEWTECVPCANRTRTFTIPARTAEAEPGAAEQSASRRLLKADDRRPGNSNSNGAQPGGNGRQDAPGGGSPHWAQGSGSAQSYSTGSQMPGFDRRPPQATQSSQGLAHAFGQGHSLGLALGQIACAVENSTVAVEACECPDGYCSSTPVETDDDYMFQWDCVTGTANGMLCAGTCSTPAYNINGTAEALCIDRVYTVTNNTCVPPP